MAQTSPAFDVIEFDGLPMIVIRPRFFDMITMQLIAAFSTGDDTVIEDSGVFMFVAQWSPI